MKKPVQWTEDVCAEKLLEVLDAHKRQLGEIAGHMRANPVVRNTCQQLWEVLDGLQQAIEDGQQIAIFLARTNQLPDFSTDDSLYGDVPF